MIMVNIHQAKAQLSSLLEKAARGERVVLCRRNVPVAEIRPLPEARRRPRPVGLARMQWGEFTVPEEFFEPLPRDVLEGFEGGGG
ncbi:MAG: type II toxin-antitoxin system prevent-host-death family antitoxin [Deltaproteobacteria bacterium]|nr:type II toxin-antitoxin system prevent-host-death family antitoxin [Deltaproteobacteria bacterium]